MTRRDVRLMDYIFTRLPRMEFFTLMNGSGDRLRVVEIGHSVPVPGRRIKRLADCWHLHLIVSGDGKYNDQPIRQGEGFIVREGEYYSEEVGSGGFEQYWINFTGDGVKELLNECGAENIFSFGDNFDRVRRLLESAFSEPFNERLSALGLLFMVCGLVGKKEHGNASTVSSHIRTAEDFVRRSYAGELSVRMIADECRVSPKYLSRVYRKERGITLAGLITETRLEAAKRLLGRSGVEGGNISQIAFAVGYNDPLYFSKVFRKRFGLPPGEFRKKVLRES